MADANPEVKVTLTAEDAGLSSALKSLSDQIKRLGTDTDGTTRRMKSNFAGLGSMLKEMGEAVKLRLANFPGLGNLGGAVAIRAYEPLGKLLEQTGEDAEKQFGAAAVAVGGVTAGLVALGAVLAGVTHHMMDLAESIENESAATGLSTRNVQELTEVAKEMGIDAGGLQMAFARVQSQLGELVSTGKAAGSGSQYFVRILRSMNVALTDAQGKLRPTNDIIGDFYEQVSKISDAGERAALEMAAFGTRGRAIAQMFEEARREGMSYRDMLASIDASGNVIPDSQLADLMEAKRDWDELTRSVRGFFTELETATAEAVLHPGALMKAIGAGIGGGTAAASIAFENALPKRPGDANSGAGAAGAMALGQALQLNETLQHRVDVLRAGGDAQLQLLSAEHQYKTAVAQGNKALADAFRTQIQSLREIIDLEAERKNAHRKAFGADDAKRAQREQYAQYARRIEQAKSAVQGLLTIENALTRAESENARRILGEKAEEIRAEQRLEEEKQRELTTAQEAAVRLGVQVAEANGDRTAGLRLQLMQREADLAKANSLGETELAAAYAKQVAELKQLISLQQGMVTSSQTLHTISQGMRGAFDSLFQSIGKGAHSTQQAFGQMELAVIHSLENIAAEMVANLAIALLTDNMKKISAAKTAAANTWASVSAIPIVGPFIAPAAAAAAFAGAMAFAAGGLVRGPGGPTGDRIPAMLSDGEFVMRAPAVRQIGISNLAAMNEGNINSAGGVSVALHPQINLYHHGDDAKKVLEDNLAPMVTDMFRRGALSIP